MYGGIFFNSKVFQFKAIWTLCFISLGKGHKLMHPIPGPTWKQGTVVGRSQLYTISQNYTTEKRITVHTHSWCKIIYLTETPYQNNKEKIWADNLQKSHIYGNIKRLFFLMYAIHCSILKPKSNYENTDIYILSHTDIFNIR